MMGSLHLHWVEKIRVFPQDRAKTASWVKIEIVDRDGRVFEVTCFNDVDKKIEVEFVEE